MSIISNDTFDELDADMDTYNETQNMNIKMTLHKELKEKVQMIEKEIDKFVNIIDEVDIDLTNKLNSDDTNIDDDIIDIDNLMKELTNEKSFEKMIEHYKRIFSKIQNCKSKCVGSGLNVIDCN
uniref:Uncharacterized protein n=1 Tax=viral metagenome TaxID=1070528 RepID=A0A6C0DXE9_9ZZZZ